MNRLTSAAVFLASLALAVGCMSKSDPRPTAPNRAGSATASTATEPSTERSPGTKAGASTPSSEGFWGQTATSIDGQPRNFSDYKGKALLIVNTASQCGYTSQYKDLQQVYMDYKARGFEVLAFPSNDFGGQEPGTDTQIKNFCSSRYQTTFPLFSKVKVKGSQKVPLYRFLTEQTAEGVRGEVRWNFTKFLVAPSGKVVARFAPGDVPTGSKMRTAIENVLPRKAM